MLQAASVVQDVLATTALLRLQIAIAWESHVLGEAIRALAVVVRQEVGRVAITAASKYAPNAVVAAVGAIASRAIAPSAGQILRPLVPVSRHESESEHGTASH